MGGYGIVGGNLPIAAGIGLASDYLRHLTTSRSAPSATAPQTRGPSARRSTSPPCGGCPSSSWSPTTSSAWAPPCGATQPSPTCSARARASACPGMRCDGMDVLDTHRVLADAVQRVREERRPVLVEAVTYRFRGHSMADPEQYRSKEEVAQWRERDPIPAFGDQLRRRRHHRRGRAPSGSTPRRSSASTPPSRSPTPPPTPPPRPLYDDVYVLDAQVHGALLHHHHTAARAIPPERDRRPRTRSPSRSRPRWQAGEDASVRPSDADPDGRDALPRGAQRRPARGAAPGLARVDHGAGRRADGRRVGLTRGLLEEFGAQRVRDTAINEDVHRRRRRGRRHHRN